MDIKIGHDLLLNKTQIIHQQAPNEDLKKGHISQSVKLRPVSPPLSCLETSPSSDPSEGKFGFVVYSSDTIPSLSFEEMRAYASKLPARNVYSQPTLEHSTAPFS